VLLSGRVNILCPKLQIDYALPRSEEGRRQRWRLRQSVRHELECAAHSRTVGGSTEADADRLRRRAVGHERIACHHANASRAGVADEGGASPGFRQRQPKVEANRVGAVGVRWQDRGRELLRPLYYLVHETAWNYLSPSVRRKAGLGGKWGIGQDCHLSDHCHDPGLHYSLRRGRQPRHGGGAVGLRLPGQSFCLFRPRDGLGLFWPA
jgi:hypothetical protein